MNKIKTGDVLFSTKNNCKITVNKITENGVLCDWFTGSTLHREIIQIYPNPNNFKLLV